MFNGPIKKTGEEKQLTYWEKKALVKAEEKKKRVNIFLSRASGDEAPADLSLGGGSSHASFVGGKVGSSSKISMAGKGAVRSTFKKTGSGFASGPSKQIKSGFAGGTKSTGTGSAVSRPPSRPLGF
jgi:hypothetical protein